MFPIFSTVAVLSIALYLGFVYQLSNENVQPVKRLVSPPPKLEQKATYAVETVYFPCSGLKCEAFLYQPKKSTNPPPVVVMASGFCAQKDFGLDQYASAFAENGYVVFLFDYRTFGGSEGEPMNLASTTWHLEDWESALDFVQSMNGVDSENIALWGSSYSGGHVVVTAAKSIHKSKIKAVLAQIPFLRAFSSLSSIVSTSGFAYMARLTFYALVDATRASLGLSRYYVPIYGSADDLAILSTPSSSKYSKIVPPNPRGGWQNKCPAAVALELTLYNPHTFAQDVKAPVLFTFAARDDLCPAEEVKETAKKMLNVQLKEIDSDHFGPYEETFQETVLSQLQFLQKYIPSQQQK